MAALLHDTHTAPTQRMQAYIVTMMTPSGKRHRYPWVGHCWYEVFEEVANEFGLAAFCSIKPVRTGRSQGAAK